LLKRWSRVYPWFMGLFSKRSTGGVGYQRLVLE
jgi:hypothetical protein